MSWSKRSVTFRIRVSVAERLSQLVGVESKSSDLPSFMSRMRSVVLLISPSVLVHEYAAPGNYRTDCFGVALELRGVFSGFI